MILTNSVFECHINLQQQTTTTKRLSVIDPEKGALVSAYENCGYSGRERAPLATHPHNPNIAVSGCTNGKGLITFDLRKQQPAHFSLNVHTTVIRDIIYLDDSWPFHQKETICSIGSDGICKIRSLDDKQLRIFGLKNRSNCLAATPDAFSSEIGNGSNRSMLMIGGDDLYGYMPGPDLEMLRCCFRTFEKSINKMKFTSNGHFLFVASGERVERYRRIDRELQFINEVYCHRSDIVDMDISHKDEYLITASRDGTVGLMCLGVPSHGWTGFMQLA